MTNEKFLRTWPQTRQRGFWRFALWRAREARHRRLSRDHARAAFE